MRGHSTYDTYNFATMTALVVDSHDFSRKLTSDLCRGFQFKNVVSSSCPHQAMEHLESRQIDIVLTDWSFRSQNGEEFIKRIRNPNRHHNSHVAMMVLTGMSDEDTVAKARNAGATDFLARPLGMDRLISRMTKVLSTPSPFVHVPGYFGPDRRKQSRTHSGPCRRQARSTPLRMDGSAITLSEAVRRPGGLSLDELIYIGERVIRREVDNFREVCRKDIKEISELMKQLKGRQVRHDELLERMYLKSHEVKGMGQSFGYPLLTEAAGSLCKLLWKLPPIKATLLTVVQALETHSMVLNLIVDQDIKGDGGRLGHELLTGLHAMTEKVLGRSRELAPA